MFVITLPYPHQGLDNVDEKLILGGRGGRAALQIFLHTIMKALHMISFILTVVGGLNWGLVGLGWVVGNGADWNVVHMVLGSSSTLEGIVYILVGLSAVWLVVEHKKACRYCSSM